ncbi:MAG: type II toxin-antitoxin system RelE/ParE family toxin [Bdellovibrionales bacterium]
MIISFGDKKTESFWQTGRSAKIPPSLKKRAYRKLQLVHAAADLEFLRVPPSHHLEKLSGDLKGFCSIRINQQFRIIFEWKGGHAHNVQIVDYH